MGMGKSILMTVIPAGVLLALAAPLVPAAPGAPQTSIPRYDIVDLGTLGGVSSVALAVNDAGQVVGSADTTQGERHAYIWDPDTGEMTDRGTLRPGTRAKRGT